MENLNHPQNSKPSLNWSYRGRAFANVMRMGHCAPTVMQTILDISSTEKEWLVRLSAGMPGGIGDTGFECGGVTSPLVLLGIHYGQEVDRGLPIIFEKGHAHCQKFLACHKTLRCKEIRGNDHFPMHCIRPVLLSPELFMDVLGSNHREAIPAVCRAAYSRLYAHLVENNFHCAQAVFIQLGYPPIEHRELFDAISAFIGGTLFMGKTCSAFTAGVMAFGLRAGEIENSYLRVIRLLTIMTAGGYAFEERTSKFNRSVNRGTQLAKWFVKEFGSTQCQAITQCNFYDPSGVCNYIDDDRLARCKVIAGKVAEKVEQILADENPEPRSINLANQYRFLLS
jgi:hypothetical protein